MWPRYRTMNCYNLFEIVPVSQFFEYAIIKQIVAIIYSFFTISKYYVKFVIICWCDF